MSAGERWERGDSTTIQPDGPWHDLVIYGHDNAGTRAFILPDWLIDAIIADHAAAARLGESPPHAVEVALDAAEQKVWQLEAKLTAVEAELHEWVNMYPASLVLSPDKLLERTLARAAGLKAKLAVAVKALEAARQWVVLGPELDGWSLRDPGEDALMAWLETLATLSAPAGEEKKG